MNRLLKKKKGKVLIRTVCLFLGILFFSTGWNVFAQDKNIKAGAEVIVQFKNKSVHLIRFSTREDAQTAILEYKDNPEVLNAEMNTSVRGQAFPNDPEFINQWYLRAISATGGWSKELLEREIRNVKGSIIAVMDSGVFIDHPDIQGKIWRNSRERANGLDTDRNGYIDDINGWDFITNTPDPSPKFDPGFNTFGIQHGTIVAGIAAAHSHNNQGISGISWESKIMPLRVLDSQGNGTVYDVLRAIDYAVKNDADVLNMSFEGSDFSQILQDIIKEAAQKGVVVVAATGNNRPGTDGLDMDIGPMSYPACLDADSQSDFILGVASLDQNLHLSDFSNFGSKCTDIAAPGENFLGTSVYNKNYPGFESYYSGPWSGTSLSAPIVSAAAAIVKSLRPDLPVEDVFEILLSSADNIDNQNAEYAGKFGRGNVNLERTVKNTLAYGVANTPQKAQGKTGLLVAGLGYGSFPQVKLFSSDFHSFKEFFAYAPTFGGSIRVVSADLDNNGRDEYITSAGVRGGPHVRVVSQEGTVIHQFFAFDKNSRGGVNIAVGDINGDGKKEIIAGSGKGQNPEVKIFSSSGQYISNFFTYDANMKDGVYVASGDTNKDGIDEIITSPGNGIDPFVRIFDSQGNELNQFLPYGNSVKHGFQVTAGDINGDGFAEIIVSPLQGGEPVVKIFSGKGKFLQSEIVAYAPSFLGGVNVTIGDIDGDSEIEIITGPGPGGGPHVRIFNLSGALEGQFFAHTQNYAGGVRVYMSQ